MLARAWRLLVRLGDSWIGDVIGAICLFVMIFGMLWLGEAFR
ncbi:hypothetical protein [Cognatishimia sp. MH4019]|nr:hypothetical protein [Cognatishimia sp. MH4019]